MALGSIVIDLLMRTGAFETDSKKAEQRLKEMKKTAVDVGTVIGTAIAGGVTVATAAIVSWTREITELSEQTRILSGLSGTTSTMFQEWAIGAQTVGIEQDKLADILKDVQDKVGDFIQTGGGPLADFFEQIAPKIGLTAEQLARMSGPDALQAYVSALESANISQSEMTFYMEAIASDSSKLIPLLADGGREMREWGEAAREAGAVMSDDMIAALRESQKEIDKLALAYRGTKIEVVQGVTPAIQDFTDLLNDSDTREGLSTLAGGLVTIATKALEAATAIGKLVGRYTEFLSNRGFTPVDDDSTVEELEARRARVQDAMRRAQDYPSVFGADTADRLQNELRQINGLLNAGKPQPAGQYLNLPEYLGGAAPSDFSVVPFSAVDYSRPTSGGGRDADDAAKTSQRTAAKLELTEAEKQYQEVMEVNAEIDRMAAQYQTDLVIAAGERAVAEEEVARQREESYQRLLSDMQFERELLGMTNEERERALALRAAGVDLTEEMRDAILAEADALSQDREQAALLTDVKNGLSDMFVDFISGAKSAQEAFGDFADMLFERALQFVADKAIQAMFDAFSGGGSGGSGGGGGGGWIDTAMELFGSWFGGARAGGGPMDPYRAYLVGEKGPELVVPRAASTVVPAVQTAAMLAGGGSGVSQTNHFHYAAPYDARTEQQVAARIAFETDRAQRRNR